MDHIRDHPPDALRRGGAEDAQGLPRQVGHLEHAGPHAVVDIMVDVRDDVGNPGDLTFNRHRPMIGICADRDALFAFRVLHDPIPDLPREIQTLATLLHDVDDPKALLVVVEATRHEIVQHALTGVAERRVPQVVPERHRLSQLLVQPQHLGDRTGDLGHLEGVRQARPVMVAGWREEDLRLVLQASERLAVNDPISVTLERRPNRIFGLLTQPALRIGALACVRRQELPLASFEVLADTGHSQITVLGSGSLVLGSHSHVVRSGVGLSTGFGMITGTVTRRRSRRSDRWPGEEPVDGVHCLGTLPWHVNPA